MDVYGFCQALINVAIYILNYKYVSFYFIFSTDGISRRFVRNKDGSGTEWLDLPKHPDFPIWEESKLIPVEVKKGTCIILHGSVVHMSYENKSNESRHAYTLHVIDGTAKYPENNWLQRPKENPFRGFIPLPK